MTRAKTRHLKSDSIKMSGSSIMSSTGTIKAATVSQEENLLVNEDVQGSQEVILEGLSIVCQQLKKTDVRAYGRFVKKIRRIINDEPAGNDSSTETLGVMQNNPIWPEIVQLIESHDR